MAKRLVRRARPLIALAALVGSTLAAPSLAAPSVAWATPRHEPTVASVEKQLGQLALRNSQLVEKYDQAQVAVGKRDQAAKSASKVAATAAATYTRTRAQFVQIIQAQYENESFGAASALLDSNSGTNYLDRLTTMDLVTAHTAQVVKNVTASRNQAQAASIKAKQLLASAKQQRAALASKRDDTQQQIDKYKALLDTLSASQQAAYRHAANPSVPVKKMHLTAAGTGTGTGTGTGAARRAVLFALDQVGKPYVFGAAGPGSYDCSGLTMASWRRGGVSLPHSAAGQYSYGHHVARSQLQPGDLIFFYQPIGHVTIYIGDGLMVSAPTEGEPVEVVSLAHYNSDYVGATRLT